MKGNGTIIEENGRFRAFFTHNNKRISKRFSTRAAAADWLAVNRADVALGEWVEPTGITLGAWVLEFLRYAAARLKPQSIANYKTCAKRLAPLADVRLQALNGVMLQKIIDSLPGSSQKMMLYKFCNVLVKRALRLSLIRKNIMEQVDAPKYTPQKKDVFSKAELERVYKVLEGNRHKVFFVTAIATGARLGELLGLKIQSVHDGFIRIENNISKGKDATPKTASGLRDITLPAKILTMLREEWHRNGAVLGGYVFSLRAGAPISPLTIEHQWKAVLLAAGVPYRNFHYIRHTHATTLLSQGIPILEVQHRLGHASASTTLNKYGHILIDNKEKILSALDNITKAI